MEHEAVAARLQQLQQKLSLQASSLPPDGPLSRLHLGCISAASRLHLGCTSAALRLHFGCTSAASPRQVRAYHQTVLSAMGCGSGGQRGATCSIDHPINGGSIMNNRSASESTQGLAAQGVAC